MVELSVLKPVSYRLFFDGVTIMPSKEEIMAQVERDRLALAALSPAMRNHLEMVVATMRTPAHTNFSDPEPL